MFKNCGKSLKNLSLICFWIGVIFSVFFAVVCFDTSLIGVGLCVLIFGPLVSYLSVAVIYTLGDIHERLKALNPTPTPIATPPSFSPYFYIGMKVHHKTLGDGVVVDFNHQRDYIKILFQNNESREFFFSYLITNNLLYPIN